MITRTPGEGAYARLEREQRWRVPALPHGAAGPVLVTDRYLDGTGLRLRRMQRGDEVVFKLAQKVRPVPSDPGRVKITNLYLPAHEFDVLARLEGAVLDKTRWGWSSGGRRVAVDQFHGALEGLFLAEVELDPGEPRLAAPRPDWVDVTDDDRYSGGSLARAGEEDRLRLLDPPFPA